jgi:nicotinamidase-related amidase
MKVHGLIIDPQEDFCNPETGTLYVPGAEEDVERLAGLVRRLGGAIDRIHVTLDSHHYLHVAHPVWWIDASGRHPAPFTIISADDVDTGRWYAARPKAQERSAAYVRALARNGRYPLCIWPYHCLIGSAGHAVAPVLFAALSEWESGFRIVDFVGKGSSIWTEHYSAIRADVPDPADPSTLPNQRLLDSLAAADVIFLAGEASSHCVANTVRDLAGAMGDTFLRKLVLLRDATSAVTGFEQNAASFLREMTGRGMRTATAAEFLP